MKTEGVLKIQELYDELTEQWFVVYQAPGIERRPITAEVPREVQRPDAVRAHLLSKGAEAAAVEDTQALTAAIAMDAPVVRRAARTGWRNDNQLFVSHRVVSPKAAESALLPPKCPLLGAAGQVQVCGTLKDWRQLVGSSKYSTAMIVALCAVFAAPLLALLNRPSFALVLFGLSKIGKSFAQLIAASALGFGREKDLPSLNATAPGLLAAALAFNDHMFPINEVGTARGKKSDVYVVLRDATYALMNGQDTLRHPSWTGATGGASSTFQVICLLSSEISPDAWAARNGETRDDGEMARLIGLPVLFPGCNTIFDRSPATMTTKTLPAWEKAQFRRLTQELPGQRGVAFAEYLDDLLDDVSARTARAHELVAKFEEIVGTPDMSQVQRDIVAKFGVLFAGGVMAAEAKILPISKRIIGEAVRDACRDALGVLPDPEGELRADLAALEGRLNSGALINLDESTFKQMRLIRSADGFYKQRDSGRDFVIRAQVFIGWHTTTLRARRLLEWLDDEGFLNHGRDRSYSRSNEWAQKQVTWPDGTRVRSISLYLPNGLADLRQTG